MNSTQITVPKPFYLVFALRFLAAATTVGLTTAVGKHVFDISNSTFDLGLLGLAEFIPTALLAPISGPLSDKYDRRLLIGFGLAINAAAAIGLALYATTEPTSVLPIFLFVSLLGIGQGFIFGSLKALPIDLALEEAVEKIMAIFLTSRLTGSILGPVAAGFLYVINPTTTYTVFAIGLATACLITSLIPKSKIQKTTTVTSVKATLQSAAEGLRFVRKSPIVKGAMTLDLFAVLLGGAVALLPAIAEERLGVGAVGLGWLRASIGIGAALTTIIIAWKPIRRHIGIWFFASVGVFGVMTIVLGLSRSYPVAFLALLILSAADGVSVFVRSTLIPMATPEHMRGRVLSVESIFIGGSNELGAFQSGVASSLLGLTGAIVFGGLGTLAVVGTWWLIVPQLRNLDRFVEAKAT